MAGSSILLRRNRAVRKLTLVWGARHADIVCGRTRDAVECLKRALLGVDARETTINLKLAKLHEELDEPTEAVAYHRRVVEICRAEGGPITFFCLLWHMLTPLRAPGSRLCQV